MKVISRKIVPNKQLLEEQQPVKTLTINEDENKFKEFKEGNNNIKLIPQNQLKYLNVNGTVTPTQEVNIKDIIKNTHNKNNTLNIYNHKGNANNFLYYSLVLCKIIFNSCYYFIFINFKLI